MSLPNLSTEHAEHSHEYPRPLGAPNAPDVTARQHFVAGQSFDDATLADRRNYLGASEVPAVLGLDPYRSPLDVYLEKKAERESFRGNEFTEWGLRIEPVIRAKFAELRSVDVIMPGRLIHHAEPWAACTPDGICIDRKAETGRRENWLYGLEIKNKGARQAHKWGPAGTDEIPHEVAAQVHYSMLITGVREWAVAALFGGNEFRTYHLVYDAELADTIMEECYGFWHNHVVAGVAPQVDGSESATRYLKERFAKHTGDLREATRAEDELIAALRSTRDHLKHYEEAEARLKNLLMQAIGEHAGLMGRSGRVTWKAPSGMQTSWKDVAAALNPPPELIAQHSTPMSRRFLATFPKDD